MSILGSLSGDSARRVTARSSSKGLATGRMSSKPAAGAQDNSSGMSSMKASDLIARKKHHEEMLALSKGLVEGITELERGGTYRGYDYKPPQEEDDEDQGAPIASGTASGNSPVGGGMPSAATKAAELQRREAEVISSQRAAHVEEDTEVRKPALEDEEEEEAEEGSEDDDDCSSENSFLEYEGRELEEAITNDSLSRRIKDARSAVECADKHLANLKTIERYRVAHSLNIWFQGALVGCDERLEKLRLQEESHGEIFRVCDESLEGVRSQLSKNEMDSLCRMNEFGAKLRSHGSGRRIKQRMEAEREMEVDEDGVPRPAYKYNPAGEQHRTINSTIEKMKAQLGEAHKEMADMDEIKRESKMPKASDLLAIIAEQQEEVRQLSLRQQLFEQRIKIAEACKAAAFLNTSRKSELVSVIPPGMADSALDLLKEVKDSVKQKCLVKKMQEDDDLKYQLLDGEDVRGKPDGVNAKDFYKSQADTHAQLENECNDLNAIIAHLKKLRESDEYASMLTDSIEKAMLAAQGIRKPEMGDNGDSGMTKGTKGFPGGLGSLLFGGPSYGSDDEAYAGNQMLRSTMTKMMNSAQSIVSTLATEKQKMFAGVVNQASGQRKPADGANSSASPDSQTAKRGMSQTGGNSEAAAAGNAGGAAASPAVAAAGSNATNDASASGTAGEIKPEPKPEPKPLKRGRRNPAEKPAAAPVAEPSAPAQAAAPPAAASKAEDAPRRGGAAQAQVQGDAAANDGTAQAGAHAAGAPKDEKKTWAQAGAKKAKEKQAEKQADKQADKKGAEPEPPVAVVPIDTGPPVTEEDLEATEEEHASAKANLERLQGEWETLGSETARLEAQIAELKARGAPPPPTIEAVDTAAGMPDTVEGMLDDATLELVQVPDASHTEALAEAMTELDEAHANNDRLHDIIEQLEEKLANLHAAVHEGPHGSPPADSSDKAAAPATVPKRRMSRDGTEWARPPPLATLMKSKAKDKPSSQAAQPGTGLASTMAVSKGISKFKKLKNKNKGSETAADQTHGEETEAGSTPASPRQAANKTTEGMQGDATKQNTTAATIHTNQGSDQQGHSEQQEPSAGNKVFDLLGKKAKGKGGKLLDLCKTALKAKKQEQYEKDVEEIFELHKEVVKLHEELEVIERQIKAVKGNGGSASGEIMKMFEQDAKDKRAEEAEETPPHLLELRQTVKKKQHELKKLRQIWWQKKPKTGKGGGAGGAGGGAGPAAHSSQAKDRWDMVRQSQGMTLMDRVLGRLASGSQGDVFAQPTRTSQRQLEFGDDQGSAEQTPQIGGLLGRVKAMAAAGKDQGEHKQDSGGEGARTTPRGIQVVRSGGFRVKLKVVAAMAKGTEPATTKIPELQTAPNRRASLADLLSAAGDSGQIRLTSASSVFEQAPAGISPKNDGPGDFPVRTPRKSIVMGSSKMEHVSQGRRRSSGRDQSPNQWFEAVKVAVAERPPEMRSESHPRTASAQASEAEKAPELGPATEVAPAAEDLSATSATDSETQE